MLTYSIREAPSALHKEVEAFYATVGETVAFVDIQTVIVAEIECRIVGALRIVREHGHLILRTVNVHADHQRQGVGTALLKEAMSFVGAETCYCLPYPHLKEFYQRFGFEEVALEGIPSFLQERYQDYAKSFAVIAMCKS